MVNKCLKRLFYGYNVLLGIAGVLLFVFVILGGTAQKNDLETSVGLVLMGVIAGAFILLSIMGVYGGCKENVVMLRSCLGIMAFGTAYFFYISSKIAISKPKDLELIKESLPVLIKETEFQKTIMVLQENGKCCGINSYKDWVNQIPGSCECPKFMPDPSHCMKVKPTNHGGNWGEKNQSVWIYKDPCGPLILKNYEIILNATIGLFVGLGFLTLIGLALFYLMGVQMKNGQSSSTSEDLHCLNPTS
ncbi:hypothetical protein UPYG_G00249610 [Umbra pygmaea]|uniref:Tetraspanin n=1 Tax=Umbra pygmaea TaxID=75934 RepID=A0ABD0WBL8_UMBPY